MATSRYTIDNTNKKITETYSSNVSYYVSILVGIPVFCSNKYICNLLLNCLVYYLHFNSIQVYLQNEIYIFLSIYTKGY